MGSQGIEHVLSTFLFTDVVDSTRLWNQAPAKASEAFRQHAELLEREIAGHGGRVFKSTGDGVAARFEVPAEALDAAGAIQLAVDAADSSLTVRVGVNTGEAEPRGGDYYGGTVNLAARITELAHGGQIVVGETTAQAARPVLGAGLSLRDLGEHWLRGFDRPHRLYQLDHVSSRRDFPPLTLGGGGRGTPMSRTSFVNRAQELTALGPRLQSTSLVTLVGPGGVGKTRLAQELARRVSTDYADGVWWCPLAPVGDAGRVAHAVATELNVAVRASSALDAVVDHLQRQRLLLVIDNCEHHLHAVRELVDAITLNCPDVVVLATSRETLRLPGEFVHVVDPLGCEAGEGDDRAALDLFIERARAAGARAVPGPLEPQLADLCRRLDGLPLAIELAAARARQMSVDELRRRLDERFSLLALPRPLDADARHQALQRTVAWSYELLADDLQRLFELLGVFRGGFDLDAATDVAFRSGFVDGNLTDRLFELIEKSLISPDTSGALARYHMLETLREFAFARLAERGAAEAVGAAHAVHYRDFAEQAEQGRNGPDERVWVEAQLRDFDNLRTAVAFAVANDDVDTALRIYMALYELASFQGRVEIFEWFNPAHYVDTDHDLVPAALAMSGMRHDPLNPVSLDTIVHAIDLQRQRGGREHRIFAFAEGFAEMSRRNTRAGLAAYARAADVIAEVEGENGRWINARGLVIAAAGNRDEAERLLVDARRVGQPSGIASALLALARAVAREDPESALELVREAWDVADSVYNRHSQIYIDLTAASIVSATAETEAGLAYLERALTTACSLRQREAMLGTLGKIVGVLRRTDQDKLADRLLMPWIDAFPEAGARDVRVPPLSVRRPPGARVLSVEELLEHTREIIDAAHAPT